MTRRGNRTDFRFAIGSAGGAHSSVWHVCSRRDHVYARHAASGGIHKFSFHAPNIGRHAFTQEYAAKRPSRTREAQQWLCAMTPPAGSGRAACLLVASFPTAYLSTRSLTARKPLIWLPAAPLGHTRIVRLVLTHDNEAQLWAECLKGPRSVVAYSYLSDGRGFALLTEISPFSGNDFRMPASHHETRDLVISSTDPHGTGRPITFTMRNNPGDGDAIEVLEFGAYWEAHDPSATSDTFTRQRVIDRHPPDSASD